MTTANTLKVNLKGTLNQIEVNRMDDKSKIDKSLELLEYIVESDPRTIRNPECENAWIYDKIHEAILILRFGRDAF